jgi:hypothetical protein
VDGTELEDFSLKGFPPLKEAKISFDEIKVKNTCLLTWIANPKPLWNVRP